MDDKNNIELRTDEVRDILQKMPNWTIRWGTTIIFAAVALLLFFSYLYRYPDLIRSQVVVSASNPPAEIKARSTGKIISLLVANNETVDGGQKLAVIENPANLKHISEVEIYLNDIEPFLIDFGENHLVQSPQNLLLGEVQTSYSEFQKLLNDYLHFIHQDYYNERIVAIDGQIEMKDELLNRLEVQKKLEEERYQLSTQSYRRDSQLRAQAIISMEDFENSRSSWLNAGLLFESVKKDLVNTRSSVYELQQQKAALQLEHDNELKTYRSNLTQTYELVKSNIDSWYLNYVLVSPITGVTSFNKVWAVNQNVSEGETVMTIVPQEPEHIIGKAFVSVRGAGKVKPGQRVNIKLSNYPYMEYGMLIGTVKSKAPVPVNNAYSIEINLPNQLTTNYGRTLDMQQELWGDCEIITEDLRLIQRIIYPVKALLKANQRNDAIFLEKD